MALVGTEVFALRYNFLVIANLLRNNGIFPDRRYNNIRLEHIGILSPICDDSQFSFLSNVLQMYNCRFGIFPFPFSSEVISRSNGLFNVRS
jgi:hypothetical protein